MSLLQAHRIDDINYQVGKGHMDSTISFDPQTGKAVAFTKIWTNDKAFGFTGSVKAVVFTTDDRIWSSSVHTWGVDADYPLIHSNHERTERWEETIPLDISQHATRCAIIHYYDPHYRIFDWIDQVVAGTKSVSDLVNELAPIMVALATVVA